MTVRGLLLDLDDTLIDTRSAMIAASAAAFRALWPDLSDDEAAAVALTYYLDRDQHFERYADGLLTFDQMRASRLATAHADHALVGGDVDEFAAAYASEFSLHQTTFADTLPLLDAADALGLPIVLVTNSPAPMTETKLAATGLSGRFVTEITTDTFGVGKPDPRVFAAAVEVLGVPREAVLSVGDNLVRDVRAAMAFGTQGRWLVRSKLPMTAGRSYPDDPGVPVITTLAELDLAALAS